MCIAMWALCKREYMIIICCALERWTCYLVWYRKQFETENGWNWCMHEGPGQNFARNNEWIKHNSVITIIMGKKRNSENNDDGLQHESVVHMYILAKVNLCMFCIAYDSKRDCETNKSYIDSSMAARISFSILIYSFMT